MAGAVEQGQRSSLPLSTCSQIISFTSTCTWCDEFLSHKHTHESMTNQYDTMLGSFLWGTFWPRLPYSSLGILLICPGERSTSRRLASATPWRCRTCAVCTRTGGLPWWDRPSTWKLLECNKMAIIRMLLNFSANSSFQRRTFSRGKGSIALAPGMND